MTAPHAFPALSLCECPAHCPSTRKLRCVAGMWSSLGGGRPATQLRVEQPVDCVMPMCGCRQLVIAQHNTVAPMLCGCPALPQQDTAAWPAGGHPRRRTAGGAAPRLAADELRPCPQPPLPAPARPVMLLTFSESLPWHTCSVKGMGHQFLRPSVNACTPR
jgi:hypothetical protein